MGGSGGGGTGADIPSRRVSPCTLLSYKWGYHSRWPKDGGGRFFFLSGGRVVMEGQRRIKGKRDGSGKTGTDLYGRHLLGYAGCLFFFFPPVSPHSVGSSGRGVVEGRDEGEGEVVLLRTALNGRPRAGVNWGKNGVEGWGGSIHVPLTTVVIGGHVLPSCNAFTRIQLNSGPPLGKTHNHHLQHGEEERFGHFRVNYKKGSQPNQVQLNQGQLRL